METPPLPRDASGPDEPTLVGPDVTSAGAEPARRPTAPPTALGTGATVGRYTIVSRLGAGGMGIVYRAYDPELDRRVALKVLYPGNGRDKPRARARLLREAQALAKLAHPNVVSVYDAGEYEGEVWLAMELIEGRTLAEWRAEDQPRWSEVLRVLMDAARGVAAAHASGLVHRDLKPSNVMVANDGRARVMDFGLARRGGDDSSSGSFEPVAPAPAPEDRPRPTVESLTQTHDVLGTPAYMAPEQWSSGSIDARADQFSWCVMAWEALYGGRPYGDGATATLLCEKLRPPARRSPGGRPPAWVRRVLERGLSRAPAQRWPDMRALLRVTERRLSRRRLQRVTAVLSGILILGLVAGMARRFDRKRREGRCHAAGAEIESLWPGRRAEVSAVFASADLAYIRRLGATIGPRVDTWAKDWSETRAEVCEAATIEGSVDALYRAQVERCLQTQRLIITTLLELIAKGDPMALRRAPFMAANLPPVSQCRERELLDAQPTPALSAIRDMHELPDRWLRALTLQDAGRYDDALREARVLLEEASARDWAPLKIRVRQLVGTLNMELGHYQEAAATLRRTYFEAGSAGMDSAAGLAAIHLVRVEGVMLAEPSRGRAWADHARMMMRRQSADRGTHQTLLLENEAKLARVEGDHERASSLLEQVVEQRRRSQGADHPEVALALRDLAESLARRGRHEEAATLGRRVLTMLEASLGNDHPEVAKTLFNLAEIQTEVDSEGARDTYERSRSMFESVLGSEHPELARPLHALATLDQRRGDHERARRRHEKALALREKALPAEHPLVAESVGRLAKFHRERGHFERANALYARAIELVEHTLGSQHPQRVELLGSLAISQHKQGALEEAEATFMQTLVLLTNAPSENPMQVAVTLNNFALLVLERGELSRAAELFERSMTTMRQSVGPTHPMLGYPAVGLAEIELERGALAAAMMWAETALERLSPRGDLRTMAKCRFIMARIRWAQRDEPEALALAREAAEGYRLVEQTEPRQAVEAWLAVRAR